MAFCVARLLIIAAALFTTGLRAAPPAGESPGFVPMVVNGCPIWPYTRCPGADLRHARLAGANLVGADLTGAKLIRDRKSVV